MCLELLVDLLYNMTQLSLIISQYKTIPCPTNYKTDRHSKGIKKIFAEATKQAAESIWGRFNKVDYINESRKPNSHVN